MSKAHADRNLLFGILALQMDFISRDALIGAMNAWVLEKTRPLGQILTEQGALRADLRHFVETLIEKHLEAHDNDAEKSLAALRPLPSVRQDLAKIADADLEKSLTQLSMTPRENGDPATISYSMGTSTSAGTRFRILRPHARGGLGEVYVARDQELNRDVSPRKTLAWEEGTRAPFRHEPQRGLSFRWPSNQVRPARRRPAAHTGHQ
jgi:hypothetical protein